MHRTPRTPRRLLLSAAAILALALGGCAGDDGGTDDTAADTAADTEADEGDASPDADDTDDADDAGDADESDDASVTVAIASSDFGDIVVDGDGRTLYMFVPDEGGEPTCTDDCAQAWPVFEGPATAGDGADAALLSTATHPSGATQVTYGGWPLYHFASDAAAGDVNGQGVNDVWFVLGSDGEPIRDDASASGRNTGY